MLCLLPHEEDGQTVGACLSCKEAGEECRSGLIDDEADDVDSDRKSEQEDSSDEEEQEEQEDTDEDEIESEVVKGPKRTTKPSRPPSPPADEDESDENDDLFAPTAAGHSQVKPPIHSTAPAPSQRSRQPPPQAQPPRGQSSASRPGQQHLDTPVSRPIVPLPQRPSPVEQPMSPLEHISHYTPVLTDSPVVNESLNSFYSRLGNMELLIRALLAKHAFPVPPNADSDANTQFYRHLTLAQEMSLNFIDGYNQRRASDLLDSQRASSSSAATKNPTTNASSSSSQTIKIPPKNVKSDEKTIGEEDAAEQSRKRKGKGKATATDDAAMDVDMSQEV